MTDKFAKSNWITLILILIDSVAFSICWIISYFFRLKLNQHLGIIINPLENYLKIIPLIVAVWLISTSYYGLYFHKEKTSSLNELSFIFRSVRAGFIFSVFVSYFIKNLDIGRSVNILMPIFAFGYLFLSRTTFRAIKTKWIKKGIGLTRAIVIGAGVTGKSVVESMKYHPEIGFNLLGFVDDDANKQGKIIGDVPVLGHTSKLTEIIKENNVEEVFLAIPSMPQKFIMNLIVSCEKMNVNFKVVSNLFEVITSRVKIDEINDIPVIKLANGHLPPTQASIKRVLDIIIASFLFIFVFIPTYPILWLIIKLDSKGPVIFKHRRVGKDGKIFTLYKYRTMLQDVNPFQVAPYDPKDLRITNFGRFLRKTSFDELPQIINVLKGEMSMVGPRPEMPFIVEQYDEWQKRRLDVKPGITGLWQVVGRKNLPLHMNLEYDFYYIKNQSLLLDLSILIRTIPAVVLGKGAF